MTEVGELQDASVPGDTLEYRIYCSMHEKGAKGRDDSLSRLAVECSETCRRLSGSHVWHYSPFALRPATNGWLCIHLAVGLFPRPEPD